VSGSRHVTTFSAIEKQRLERPGLPLSPSRASAKPRRQTAIYTPDSKRRLQLASHSLELISEGLNVTLRRGLLPRQLKLQVPSLPVLPRCPDGRPCGDGNARGERDQGDDHGGLHRAMRTALLRSASSYVKTRTSARVGGPVLRSDSGHCHLGRRYGPWRCEIATLS
jgi:hypothetical protein